MTRLDEGDEVRGDLDPPKRHFSEGLTDDPGLFERAEGGVDEDHPAPPDAT